MRRTILAVGLALVAGVAGAAKTSHYWEWGWGVYGSGPDLDTARFDWHMVCFGTEPTDARTVEACNRILALNPRHKLVIRVWPILGLGDCPENGSQATFLHYLYVPGTREKILAETRRQIELVRKGVTSPENVAGCCFLEELPNHFTSAPFQGAWAAWKKGDALPWDIKRFQEPIERELGEPFDWSKEAHRRWWGAKYTQVINEIDQAMKQAMAGGSVFCYQGTSFNTLDHLQAGQSLFTPGILPIRYADIVKPGFADGIFGYPNNDAIWTKQTLAMARQLKCLFFSQIATPPGMRLTTFADHVALARTANPGNLGTFLYADAGRKARAWNELPYQDDTFWLGTDHMRRFGWDHKVNMDVVNRALAPRVQLDYDFSGLKRGDFAQVQVLVSNPKHPSWYGGNAELATLKNPRATLVVPTGLSIPEENNAAPTLPLGDIPPTEARTAEWWVRIDADGAKPDSNRPLRATVATDDGGAGQASSTAAREEISSNFGWRPISRSGESWVEPAFHLTEESPAVEMIPLVTEIACPQLACGPRRAVYRDVLAPGTRLVIGPKLKARLFGENALDEAARRFGAQGNAAAAFESGYQVYGTREVPLQPGHTYRLSVTGWATGEANSQVWLRFWGWDGGKRVMKEGGTVLVNRFTDRPSTAEERFTPPAFERGPLTLQIFFYRRCPEGKAGAIFYNACDLRDDMYPAGGLDVSGKLDGILSARVRPFSQWTYLDESDPQPYVPKLRLRFLPAAEIAAAEGTAK